ncbi:MAG: 50S ribosomal protein L33 [Parcubacteria group bacterium]|nr:50S ribosomal protein L33 [Parcubacteria group bacterium]
MKKENIIKLQCSVCKHINYYTRKNKKIYYEKRKYHQTTVFSM